MTLRAIVTGRTLSGKTGFLWRRWLSDAPRLLTIDQGEWTQRARDGKLPGAVIAYGADEVIERLAEVAGRSRWHIIADCDRHDLARLERIFLPDGRWHDSPVIKLGGFALFMDEIDLLMPLGDAKLSGFFRRGRHVGLSVYGATQRIGSVNKEVTSQVSLLGILSIDEVSDVKYLRNRMGVEKATRAIAWANSAPYRSAVYAPPTAQLWLLEPEPPAPGGP